MPQQIYFHEEDEINLEEKAKIDSVESQARQTRMDAWPLTISIISCIPQIVRIHP